MYYGDFDRNKRTETVIAIEKNKKYYPLLSYDELAEQMVVLMRKKFNNYSDFAGKTVDEVFGEEVLKNSSLLQVHTLASGFLKNENGTFSFHPFPGELQVSPITDFLVYDFNNDGVNEALTAGNYFGVKPFHGRFDSFSGALIKNEKMVILSPSVGLDLSKKAVRKLNIINIKGKPYLLVTVNNAKAEIYEINQ